MSIRRLNKDHLQKSVDKCVKSLEFGSPPEPQNQLQFWVQHSSQDTFVDLTDFAGGSQEEVFYSGKWIGGYSGRPRLIRQLAPALKANLLGVSSDTVRYRISALRMWWRLFDRIENAAKQAGEADVHLEDVRQLTRVYSDYARQSGMYRTTFNFFTAIADVSLKELGAPKLYWDSPVDPKVNRNLPPEIETAVLRIALKQAWQAVRRQWSLMDRLQDINFVPVTEEESNFFKHWCYFNKIQRKYNVILPTTEQLIGKHGWYRFKNSKGLSISTLRESVFPSMWDAHTAFHMCLANTGWNPAVLAMLDVKLEDSFLRNHPQDESRYILVGTKARGGGKEQYVGGLWKTTWGPGPIIRDWLKRVVPLRKQLQAKLLVEQDRYGAMLENGAPYDELVKQYKVVQRLERGTRSVWLFVGKTGYIGWVESSIERHYLNGKDVSYLDYLTYKINEEREARGEFLISSVKASDFRDIFAMYIWRQSGSNILVLMRLLHHAQLKTTQRYVDNNILNAERAHKIRIFVEDLFSELGQGRLDITILAHRQQFGSVTPEMEKRLHDYRALERSRLSFGCKNPHTPPIAIQPDTNGSKRCGQQRCLLCSEGVMLPESIDGVAMRVEELKTIQSAISVEAWLTSDFPQELTNGLNALKLFPVSNVRVAMAKWAQAISSGMHRAPGIGSFIKLVEVI